jgi:hypothetical protein
VDKKPEVKIKKLSIELNEKWERQIKENGADFI